MLLDVVRIGNSKGIRLPAVILKECNISDKVEMEVIGGKIILMPSEDPRKDWDIKFKEMNASDEDVLLITDEELTVNLEDWEW